MIAPAVRALAEKYARARTTLESRESELRRQLREIEAEGHVRECMARRRKECTCAKVVGIEP